MLKMRLLRRDAHGITPCNDGKGRHYFPNLVKIERTRSIN
jgi:hypothetical protein